MTAQPRPEEPGARPLANRWTDVLRADALVHVALFVSMAAATFQAYLKDRMPGPVPYVLADAAFLMAALLWLGTLAVRREPIRGPSGAPLIVLTLIVVPVLYLLHPGPPVLVELAGLRAWSLFPVAALIGMTTIRSLGQLRAYAGVIVGLSVITALYGIRQYLLGPEVVFDAGALAVERHGTSIYYVLGDQVGEEFRAFSTFTFPAPFAHMMVFGMLLAAGVATSASRPPGLRWLAAATLPVLFLGMTVSGTRAALVVLIVGLLVLAWYRRLAPHQMLLVPFGVLAVHVASVFTAGRMVERYGSVLLQEGLLWRYVSLPARTAWASLGEHPLGLGLGRTGVGVPFPISSRMPEDYFVFTDGDLGRAAVELGVVGVVLLALILVALLRYVPSALRALRASDADDIVLGAGALVLASAVLMLIGSPFSFVPHGVIWWFFFGALLRVAGDLTPPPEHHSGPAPGSQ